MFYLYQGYIHVTPGGQTVKQFIDLKMEFSKEDQLAEICAYIFHVFTKKDNPYWGLPPKERRTMVLSQYSLFENWVKFPSYVEVESHPTVKALIDFYVSIVLTDNDRNEEAFRTKAEHWRQMLLDNKKPDDEETYFKALTNATKMAEEYAVKSLIEAGNEAADGHPLYLFEIPENKKDHHLRLKM